MKQNIEYIAIKHEIVMPHVSLFNKNKERNRYINVKKARNLICKRRDMLYRSINMSMGKQIGELFANIKKKAREIARKSII